jgi:hypothetical protein
MTLATLEGMNFNMGDVANALKLKTAETVASGAQKMTEVARKATGKAAGGGKAKGAAGNGAATVDPLQWWGALTQQFQEIAAGAMKDVAQKTAVDTARNVAAGVAKDAMKAARKPAKTARKPAAKAPARKTARKA